MRRRAESNVTWFKRHRALSYRRVPLSVELRGVSDVNSILFHVKVDMLVLVQQLGSSPHKQVIERCGMTEHETENKEFGAKKMHNVPTIQDETNTTIFFRNAEKLDIPVATQVEANRANQSRDKTLEYRRRFRVKTRMV